MKESAEVLFPSTAADLPLELDPNAQTLFDISSEFPERMMEWGRRAYRLELSPNARGMAFNADMFVILQLLDIGNDAMVNYWNFLQYERTGYL
jgi:hypothetical protein